MKTAELELTRIYTSLTLVASLTGRPKWALNAGSAWGAIEAMDDRFEMVRSDTGANFDHLAKRLKNLEASVGSVRSDVSCALSQAASASTQAAHARGVVSIL